jgi:Helicase associated domain
MVRRLPGGVGAGGENRRLGRPQRPAAAPAAAGCVAAAVRPSEARTAPPEGGARAAAFERGLAAAQQYLAREGTLDGVPRKHTEMIIDEVGDQHSVRLGVWLSNMRSRRGGLTPERAEALNQLGLRWI